MTERDDRHDLPVLRRRLEAARKRFAGMRVSNQRDPGPTDPATGESWHRGNVLGHVKEMLPFWTEQLRLANSGSGKIGRDESGAKSRRQGIDSGDAAGETQLRLDIEDGIGGVLLLMEEMSPADLERTVVYTSREGTREAEVGELLQLLIVRHLEDHLEQLAELD
jgi:DinB family protein